MSATPSPADSSLAQAHRLALASLREMGMEIASRLHAHSQDPDADLGEVATKFARVARAVRQTIALEARLEAEAQRRAAPPGAGPRLMTVDGQELPEPGVLQAEYAQRTAENKLEAVTLVRRLARKTPGFDRERFDEALDERLDADPYDHAFDPTVEISQTIAQICTDLGLAPDFGGFSNLDWQSISRETRAALTGEAIDALPFPLWSDHATRYVPNRTIPEPEGWTSLSREPSFAETSSFAKATEDESEVRPGSFRPSG